MHRVGAGESGLHEPTFKVKRICRRLCNHYYCPSKFSLPTPGGGQTFAGMMTTSLPPPSFPEIVSSFTDKNRVFAAARLIHAALQKPVLVLTTHLMREPDSTEMEKIRVLEVQEMLRYIDAEKAKDANLKNGRNPAAAGFC